MVASEIGFTGEVEEVCSLLGTVDPATFEVELFDADEVDVEEPEVVVEETVAGVATCEMPMTEELSAWVDEVEGELAVVVDELVEEVLGEEVVVDGDDAEDET